MEGSSGYAAILGNGARGQAVLATETHTYSYVFESRFPGVEKLVWPTTIVFRSGWPLITQLTFFIVNVNQRAPADR